MAKKGGLGCVDSAPQTEEDLLNSVFGDSSPKGKAKGVLASEGEKVAKYFRIDKGLAKRLRIFAAEHDLKEIQVIEQALLLFFEKDE